MASRTYALKALVLRKTKLGEGDLIVTFLAEDGSSLRAVAKGARKPSSVFASRLELYAEVDLLCAEGRSLDIVKEARLVDAHASLRGDVERAAAAACMCELRAHGSRRACGRQRLRHDLYGPWRARVRPVAPHRRHRRRSSFENDILHGV